MRKPFWLRLWILLLPACGSAPDPEADFFLARAASDPELRIEDAYKWLYHATRGGEHALDIETAARLWLEHEWAALEPPAAGEPLWEPLSADGRIGRLHLRPYRQRGGDLPALHQAFVAGATSFDSSPGRFLRAWRALGRTLTRSPRGYLTGPEWRRLDRLLRAQGYPPIHHSPEYEHARRPAYRVLPGNEARHLIETLPPAHRAPP